MKKLMFSLIAIFMMGIGAIHAQVTQVDLVQQKGVFTTESLTLEAGEYQFNVQNDDVGHDVGFVLVPKGMYDASKHIKDAYVKTPVATGSTSMTNVVDLKPGEYEYFCPMNKTPKYTLTVTDSMDKMHKGDKMMDKSDKMMGKSDKMMDKSDKMMDKSDKMMDKSDKMMDKADKMDKKM